MGFKKTAFPRTEHEKVCREILGKEYKEVHQYMDGRGGFSHRVKHGHNKEAEEKIRRKFEEGGVKAFYIHLICDDIHKTYLQDKIIPEVKKRFEDIIQEKETPPYFEESNNLYCQKTTQQGIGADPHAKITTVLDKCGICGGKNNLVQVNMGVVCVDCYEKRGIITCAYCHKPVSITCAVPDKIDGRHKICKVCSNE